MLSPESLPLPASVVFRVPRFAETVSAAKLKCVALTPALTPSEKPHMTSDSHSTNLTGGEDPRLPRVAESRPSYDTIALKAYFIALNRHARGELANTLKD